MLHRDDRKRAVSALVVGARLALIPGILTAAFAADAAADERILSPDEIDPSHLLAPVLEYARGSWKALEQVQDFHATFSKRERIDGKLQELHTMQVKLRHEPFSVYMKFLQPHAGREVLFVDGRNDGKLLAHETGIRAIAGTVALAPDSERALAEGRHPITMMGMRPMLGALILQWQDELKYGEVDVKYYKNARLGQTECLVFETSHPAPRRQFKFHMTRLYLDKQTRLPIRVEQYGFPTRAGEAPPLMEEYTYSQIRTNVRLTDLDFDPQNPEYEF